jgi:malonate decarboxylase gamma subunit
MVRHALLESRLALLQRSKPAVSGERLERKDFAKLFPDGHSLVERDGIVSGEAMYHGVPVQVLGMVNRRPLGAVAAWALADAVWRMLVSPPAALHILIDCESHAATLDDERVMLSAYLADLALALFALEQAGVHIEVTVLGKLGGGVYVALAAPASQVNLLYGMQIQLLPGSAIASILGAGNTDKFAFADYHQARVADQELKLGLVP